MALITRPVPVLRGWSPSVEDDQIVHVPYISPAHFLASTSSTPSPRQSIAPSSDRRAQRNRTRDPTWIPRPRNAFIIFRCQYSRRRSQAAQHNSDDDSDDDDDDDDSDPSLPNRTTKTLSKRAADAWKQLSPSEKNRYKILADKEREEHARIYPHYRFRPMRRQFSGLKKRQCGLSNADDTLQQHDGFHFDTDTSTEKLISNPSSGYQFPESRHRLDVNVDVNSTPPPPPSLTAIASSHSSWDECLRSPCIPIKSTSSHDNFLPPYEDMERAQALEAYSAGLHNYDLFINPLDFPEYHDPNINTTTTTTNTNINTMGGGISCNNEYSALFPEQVVLGLGLSKVLKT